MGEKPFREYLKCIPVFKVDQKTKNPDEKAGYFVYSSGSVLIKEDGTKKAVEVPMEDIESCFYLPERHGWIALLAFIAGIYAAVQYYKGSGIFIAGMVFALVVFVWAMIPKYNITVICKRTASYNVDDVRLNSEQKKYLDDISNILLFSRYD